MFTLSEHPLNLELLTSELQNDRAGAVVSFDGRVRNHHDGRAVTGLTYEAFPDMALNVGEDILSEAMNRFHILGARAEHYVGEAAIGDCAVWVGVCAEHRQEAFLACRWIMDRIKADVPIWKKEFYVEGDSVWVHAGKDSASVPEDPAEDPRYVRQVRLPEIGPDGQRKLAGSRVLVIGVGGLGCPALLYLAAAGVGSITLCDGDRVDESNLHRQPLFLTEDIGRKKAECAADRLRAYHPGLSLQARAEAADVHNLPSLVREQDIVLDCTDSFESKYLIHDTCYRMGIPLVQAAVYQFEGWVQLIDSHQSGGCFRCLWPEAPPAGCVGTCAEAGVLGVTPGLLGMYQAVETLKYLAGLPHPLNDATLYVDVLSGQTRTLKRPVRDECPCRGKTPWPVHSDNLLSPGKRADELFRDGLLVDIREPEERIGNPDWVQESPNMPRMSWADIPEKFSKRPLILCCAAGIRTRQCLEQLHHPPGIYAWTRSILEAPKK